MITVSDAPASDVGRLDRRSPGGSPRAPSSRLAVVAAWLVPWDWAARAASCARRRRARSSRQRQLDRADAYAWPVRYLSWTSWRCRSLAAARARLHPAGGPGSRAAGTAGRRWWLAALVGRLRVLLVVRLVTLPFALLRAVAQPRRRAHQPGPARRGSWDRVLVAAAPFLVSAVLVLLVVGRRPPEPAALVRRRGRGRLVLLTFAVSFVYPVVVEPLFNRFTPLPDGALRTSILALADEEGVPVDDVLVADASRRTTTLNAYVSGLRRDTRRVVLYDTLLDDLPPDQARSVVAHELGHAKHHDVLLGTGLGSLGACWSGSRLLGSAARQPVGRAGAPAVSRPRGPGRGAAGAGAARVGELPGQPGPEHREPRDRGARRPRRPGGDGRPRVVRRAAAPAGAAARWPTPRRRGSSQLWFGSHPTVLQRVGIAAAMSEEPDRR